MKQLFTLLFVGILFISCDNNDKETEDNDGPSIKKVTMDVTYPSYNPFNASEVNFIFEYDKNNRLVKRIGGYLPFSSSTGFATYFTDKTFTTLNYNNNKVMVENFSASQEFTISKGTLIYTLNSVNQIEVKEVPNEDNFHSKKQSFKYDAGKLTEIVTSFPNLPYDPNDENDYVLTYSEKFYYDTNSNLIKTEYFEQHNGQNIGSKIVRTFENYDSSVNPFKKLQLLEGYFYRSLSKNNYRKYTETGYYGETSISRNDSSWTFNYDSNGNIIF